MKTLNAPNTVSTMRATKITFEKTEVSGPSGIQTDAKTQPMPISEA